MTERSKQASPIQRVLLRFGRGCWRRSASAARGPSGNAASDRNMPRRRPPVSPESDRAPTMLVLVRTGRDATYLFTLKRTNAEWIHLSDLSTKHSGHPVDIGSPVEQRAFDADPVMWIARRKAGRSPAAAADDKTMSDRPA